jgi:HK97 gp10 family phage protein
MLGLELRGLEDLEKAIDAMEKDFEKALIIATRKGCQVIQRGAKRRCPPIGKPSKGKTGRYAHAPYNLKKSIKYKILRQRSPARIAGLVGPAVGRKQKYDGYYGYFVEKGHRISRKALTKREREQFTGSFVKPQPFLRPALDEDGPQAQRVIAETYKQALAGRLQEGHLAKFIEDELFGE